MDVSPEDEWNGVQWEHLGTDVLNAPKCDRKLYTLLHACQLATRLTPLPDS